MTPYMEAFLETSIDATWALMTDIGVRTRGAVGITRASYDLSEQLAADATADALRNAGLAPWFDAFGNLHALLPGRNLDAPAVGMGSHLDSVPGGGNFDGLAGVMTALAILTAAHGAGIVPERGLRLVGLRGEESPWYGTAYLGSRMALGHVPFDRMSQLVRLDTGRSLAEHMAALGFDGQATEQPVLSPSNLDCWLEMHIEQGPVLIERDLPLGIATAIRGNIRYPSAKCHGVWAHSAAVPRAHRRDAVVAVAELVMRLDEFWTVRLAAGDDNFVATVGQFATNPALHAMTKVPGEVAFTVNIGASVESTLIYAKQFLHDAVVEIEQRRGVRIELGADVGSRPAPLNAGLMATMEKSAAALGLPSLRMPTVGHDAGMFEQAGIPSAVLLVRNAHGSHNANEAMTRNDYAAAVRTMAHAALSLAQR